jgi:FkbM family methyltransferase
MESRETVATMKQAVLAIAERAVRATGVRARTVAIHGTPVRVPFAGHDFALMVRGAPHWTRHKEAEFVDRVLDCIRPGDTLFDVGAFTGYFTLVMGLRTGRGGKVVAFEPNPISFASLSELVALNRDRLPPVVLYNAAVADRTGTAAFGLSRVDSSLAAMSETVEVPLVTLDSTGLAPDFMKIDVEGYEMQVLRGAGQALKSARGLGIEFHPRKALEATGDTFEIFDGFLRDRGFAERYRHVPEKHRLDPGRPYQLLYARS